MKNILLIVLILTIAANANFKEHKPVEPKEPVTQKADFALQIFSEKHEI
jgi:hypothetical protein